MVGLTSSSFFGSLFCARSFRSESGFFLSLLDFFFTCFLVFFLSLFSFSSCCVLNCLTSTAIHGNCLHAPASLRCGEYWLSVEGDVFWDELHIQLFCLFHVNWSCVASDLFFGCLCTLLVFYGIWGFAGGVVGGEERRGSLWGSRD